MLQDWASAFWRSTLPCPPSFQSLNVHAPRWNSPLQYTRSIGAIVASVRPAECIDLDPLATVTTPQELVQQSLEPTLSDHVAAAVAAALELLVAGLANVAQQVSGESTIGIGPLRLDLDDHAGKLELPLLDLRHVFERQPASHAHREERVGRHAGDRLGELLIGDLEQRRHAAEDGVPVLVLARELAWDER